MALASNFGSDTTYRAGRVQDIQLKSYGRSFDPLANAVNKLSEARDRRIEAEKRREFEAERDRVNHQNRLGEAQVNFKNNEKIVDRKHGYKVNEEAVRFSNNQKLSGAAHDDRLDEISQADVLSLNRDKIKFGYEKKLENLKHSNKEKIKKLEKGGEDMSNVPDDIFDNTVMAPTKKAVKAMNKLSSWKDSYRKELELSASGSTEGYKNKKKTYDALKKAYDEQTNPDVKKRLLQSMDTIDNLVKKELDKTEASKELLKKIDNKEVDMLEIFLEKGFKKKEDVEEWKRDVGEKEIDEASTVKKISEAQKRILKIGMKPSQRNAVLAELGRSHRLIINAQEKRNINKSAAASDRVKGETSLNNSLRKAKLDLRKEYIDAQRKEILENSSLSKAQKLAKLKQAVAEARTAFPLGGELVDKEKANKKKKEN